MMDKQEFKTRFPNIERGMLVYNREGEKLGKLAEADEYSMTIEKGFFFPKDFTIRYDDVTDVSGDRIVISSPREDLDPWRNERYSGWNEIESANRDEEVRVPLREEELDVHKTQKTAGNVRVRKVVHTELRNITVPVSKEEVVVERVPASESHRHPSSEKAFREEEYNIPIREEEVDVHKHTVTKEEVRLSKQHHTEHRDVSGEVRREDVKIEGDHAKKHEKP